MEIPTVTKLQSKILSDFKSEFNLTSIPANSFFYIFSYVLAGSLYGLYFFAGKLIDNIFLDTTTDQDNILRWGTFFGIPKKQGSTSSGNISVSGDGSIPYGTILTNSIGDEYITTTDTDITDNGIIQIESKTIGIDKNLSAGNELIFQSTVEGIEPLATVSTGGIIGGADEEDIENYRSRILSRIANIQTGGNANDYINWASEIDGVGKVFVFENYLGLGVVGLTFVTDDRNNLIPNDNLVNKVEQAILPKKPFGSVVSVYKPIERLIDLTIQIKPSNDTIKNNVTEQIKEMLKNNAEVGGVVYQSKISEAISLADGEETHELPNFQNLTLNQNEIAVLGNITWTTY